MARFEAYPERLNQIHLLVIDGKQAEVHVVACGRSIDLTVEVFKLEGGQTVQFKGDEITMFANGETFKVESFKWLRNC